MSQKITVMWRRWASPWPPPGAVDAVPGPLAATAAGPSHGVPQPPQNRIPSGFSRRQLAQFILLATPQAARLHVPRIWDGHGKGQATLSVLTGRSASPMDSD